MQPTSSYRRSAAARPCCLRSPGWSDATRQGLERLIRAGSGKGLPVVFDFDNTVIGGDIGEAVLAMLARRGLVTAAKVPAGLSPDFSLPRKGRVSLARCADPTQYYEALLAYAAHNHDQPAGFSAGYVWAVQAMAGLRVADVVDATRETFEWPGPPAGLIQAAPGGSAYPVPYFYPAMVELLAEFARHDYELWIVSASNVWSVRWMVRFGLGPLLHELGVRGALPPQRVIGVATLMTDRGGRLWNDATLLRENLPYAALEPDALRGLTLTGCVQFPVPTFSGKVAVLHDALGRMPYFCAGDSPNDLPMLSVSRHRLWVSRLESPRYQQAALELVTDAGHDGWLLQPTLPGREGGLIPNVADALAAVARPPTVEQSARLFSELQGVLSAKGRRPRTAVAKI